MKRGIGHLWALLFLICSLALPIGAEAQDLETEDEIPIPKLSFVRIGVSIGPSFSWIGGVDFQEITDQVPGDIIKRDEYPVRLGYHLGLAANLGRGIVGGRASLSIFNSGALFDGSSFVSKDDLRITFITLGAQLKMKLPLKIAELNAFVGPVARYRLDVSGVTGDFKELQESLKRLNLTGEVGTTLLFKVGGVKIGPELRYGVDLSGLADGTINLRDQAILIIDGFSMSSVKLGLHVGF